MAEDIDKGEELDDVEGQPAEGSADMNIEEEVYSSFVHLLHNVVYFRTFYWRGVSPLAVKIDATCIGSQVAVDGSVNINVGDKEEGAAFQQTARNGIITIEQPVDEPLHKPFGHCFAWMLTSNNPNSAFFLVKFTKREEIYVATL